MIKHLREVGTVASQDSACSTPSQPIEDSVLRQAIECTRDGVSISDARQRNLPLVYVNPAFERMSGYSAAEVVGKNCRFLQGSDTQQPEVNRLREALRSNESCIVTFRNYRKDGVLFYNELSMSPIHDRHGEVTHFVGIQKDVTRRMRAELRLAEREEQLRALNSKLAQLAQRDGLTGLLNRRTIEECIEREWRRAMRDDDWLSVYMIDIDKFKFINDQFGHGVGDACLQRLSKVLEHCFGRGADFVGRFGGDEFIVLNTGLNPEDAVAQGRRLVATMRLAELPEPVQKVTISVGVCTVKPGAGCAVDDLVAAADRALYGAKAQGRDRLEITTLGGAS